MRRPLLAFAAVLWLAGCVDNAENAKQFCDRHRALVAAARDRDDLSADEASDIENDLEETMRDAEDATRDVRRAARDLVASYGELAGVVDDDDAEPEELREATAELQQAREDIRAACADAAEQR